MLRKIEKPRNRLSLNAIALFVECAMEGSMSAAARKLGVTAAFVSKSIVELERQLQVNLLYRTTRDMRLSSAGECFLDRAVHILNQVRLAEGLAAAYPAPPKGKVRMLATEHLATVVLSPNLQAFRTRYPAIELEIDIADRPEWLASSNGVNIALWSGTPPKEGRARRLAFAPRYFLASRSYLASEGSPDSLHHLSNRRLLSVTGACLDVEGPHGPRTLEVRSTFTSNSVPVVQSAMKAGLGIALISTLGLHKELARGEVQRILHSYESGSGEGVWARSSQANPDPAVELALEYFAEICSSAKAQLDAPENGQSAR